MSISPGFQGTGPASSGIADVVSQDDLTRFAQIAGVLQYLTAPLEDPPAATSSSAIAPSTVGAVFLNTYAALRQAGAPQGPSYLEAVKHGAAAGNVGWIAAAIIALLAMLLEPLAQVILGGLDALRKGIDPAVGELAVTVLNEFLGTDFAAAQLPLGIGTGDHLQRAQAIGGLLYQQLETEFAPAGGQVGPATAPAQTFAGLAINFGLASGIMGLIGGMVPGGFHLDELRELGEEVARNIGLGRLVRRALTPLVQTLVAQPLQWAINTKYLPSQFTEAMLVNPFAQQILPHDQLYNAMHLLGYSDDKIAAFIQMHEKRLTPAEVQILINWGIWTAPDGEAYAQRLGWPAGMAGTVLQLEGLREVQVWIGKEVDALLNQVGEHSLTVNELAQTIDQFALAPPVKDVIVALANYRAQKPPASRPFRLSEGELAEAFEAGILTASDLNDKWTAGGLSPEDQNTRMQLILLRLAHLHTVETTRQQHYQQQLLAFEAKQAKKPTGAAPPAPPIAPFPLSS